VPGDAYTRLLQRQPPDTDALWAEVHSCVQLAGGMLVVDDSTLDKPYAHHMDLVSRQWSGKHKRVVWGINLISLVWTAGDARFPVDCRLYDKAHDGLGKNDHFRDMLTTAQTRGFRPDLVAFDSWYGSLANLKQVRACDWHWLTQLKVNRHVDPDRTGNRPVSEVAVDAAGSVVHLKGYGLVRVFKMVSADGDIEYWATSRLDCPREQIDGEIRQLWHIEEYHRALKQFCGIERAQHRSARAQRNHISFALRAFLRLECHRLLTSVTWFEAKRQIVRSAIRAYLANPTYQLAPTA
jgi:putative transposase